jgi:hypothetical protein
LDGIAVMLLLAMDAVAPNSILPERWRASRLPSSRMTRSGIELYAMW